MIKQKKKSEKADISCYCIKMRRSANTLTKFYDEALEHTGLTTNQFSLLCNIKQLGICNKSELAEYVGLDRTTIIRNLNLLSKKGLIEEAQDNANHRNGLQLTESGESAIAAGADSWYDAQAKVEKLIGTESLENFMQTLKNIEALF